MIVAHATHRVLGTGADLSTRAAALCANTFILDVLRIVRGRRDVLDGVILLCLAEANWAGDRDTVQAGEPGEPNTWLRPSSIGALANSLGMPFETVRRRAVHLCEDGLCHHTDTGLVIAPGSPDSPLRPEALIAVESGLRDLYGRLRAWGGLARLPADARSPPLEPERTRRLLFHLTSIYFLRMLERLRPYAPSLLDGAIVLAVYEINLAPVIASPPKRPVDQAVAEVSHLGPRKPARTSEIALRLGLPYETIRRHAKALLARRVLHAQRRGLILPRTALLHPAIDRAIHYNERTLQRLFEGCARLGVLGEWERAAEAAATRPA